MSSVDTGNQAATAIDTSPLTPEGQTHHVQLDAIRALAVTLVMIDHYFPEIERWMEVGSVGVRVFFVISGFLITGILLRARDDAETDHLSKAKVMRNFYMRRFLRIFPLFYAVLIGTELLRFPPVRASFWWHATYLSNFFFFRRGSAFDSVTPLWSLTVEEQFYLIWPWLILYLPRRWILPVILLGIGIAPVFRSAIMWSGRNAWQAAVLTPACLDTLGLGALLAVISQPNYRQLKANVLPIALWLGLVIFIASSIGYVLHPSDWWIVPLGSSIGLWGMVLIDRAYIGFTAFPGWLFSTAPLTYLGIISYGMYMMHDFIGGFARRVLRFAGFHSPSEFTIAICMFLVTIAFASASWQFFEKPINRMKRHFPYRPA